MKAHNDYLKLDLFYIKKTTKSLHSRIQERFPESSLRKICWQLLEMSNHVESRGKWLSRPNRKIRTVCAVITALIIAVIYESIMSTAVPNEAYKFGELIQILDSLFNDILVIGGVILFFATMEVRVKRGQALKYIRELRSLSHIVDMHQLTKDPERLLPDIIKTPSSPKLDMDSYLLRRYLDYCTEMLALIAKLAAIYAQNIDDSVVLEAVNEIEMLTSNISQKVWLKVLKTTIVIPKHNFH